MISSNNRLTLNAPEIILKINVAVNKFIKSDIHLCFNLPLYLYLCSDSARFSIVFINIFNLNSCIYICIHVFIYSCVTSENAKGKEYINNYI